MIREDEINHYPTVKQSWGIAGLSILSLILFAFIQALVSRFAGEELSFLIYYLLAMGIVFWVAHRKREKATNTSAYNFNFAPAKVIIMVSIAAIAIQIGFVTPVVSLLPMPDFVKNLFVEFAKRNGMLSFITIVIAAPILEELIFRGIVLDGLLKRHSPVKSILISSVLFGIIHLNPWQFIAALIIGVFSGWVYYRTGNLSLSILIHFVNNLGAFVSMYFSDPEVSVDMSLTEQYGGVLNLILITLGAMVTAVICLHFLRLEFITKKGH